MKLKNCGVALFVMLSAVVAIADENGKNSKKFGGAMCESVGCGARRFEKVVVTVDNESTVCQIVVWVGGWTPVDKEKKENITKTPSPTYAGLASRQVTSHVEELYSIL